MYIVKHLIPIIINLLVSIINQKGVIKHLIHVFKYLRPVFSPQTQVRFVQRGLIVKKRQLRQVISEVLLVICGKRLVKSSKRVCKRQGIMI